MPLTGTRPRNSALIEQRTLMLVERFGRTEGPEALVTYEPTELGLRDFGLDLRPLRNRL